MKINKTSFLASNKTKNPTSRSNKSNKDKKIEINDYSEDSDTDYGSSWTCIVVSGDFDC